MDLEEYARAGIGLGPRGEDGRLRGYADLWDPSTGNGKHSSGRVLVSYGSEGLCLYDTKYEVKHRWKHREPSKKYSPSSPNSRRHCGSWRRGHGHEADQAPCAGTAG